MLVPSVSLSFFSVLLTDEFFEACAILDSHKEHEETQRVQRTATICDFSWPFGCGYAALSALWLAL
jgi:hypothetical protein